jgi:hypothetical protein
MIRKNLIKSYKTLLAPLSETEVKAQMTFTIETNGKIITGDNYSVSYGTSLGRKKHDPQQLS